jgi:hypothetical protein
VEAVVALPVLLVEAVDVELLLVVDVDVKPSKSIHKKPAIYIVGFFYLIRL